MSLSIHVPASPDRCPECGKAGAGDGCGTIQHPVRPASPVEGDGGDPVETAWRHLFREVDGVNFDAPGASEERALVEAAIRADECRVTKERIARRSEAVA